MSEEDSETLPKYSESVSESDLQHALHSLILYMGETGEHALDMNAELSNGLSVNFLCQISSIEGVEENE